MREEAMIVEARYRPKSRAAHDARVARRTLHSALRVRRELVRLEESTLFKRRAAIALDRLQD